MKPPHTPPHTPSATQVQMTSKNSPTSATTLHARPTEPTTLNTINDFSKPLKKPTLGDIVCAFKSKCVHEWLKHIKANNIDFNGKIWHRNYYEEIIRDEKHLNNVRQYIRDNPMKWELDLARGKNS